MSRASTCRTTRWRSASASTASRAGPGCRLENAEGIVARLLEPILEDLPFASGDRVLLFTNSMGGTPLLELYLAHGIAERLLADRGIVVARRLVGPYVTSLEMQGMSLTLLKLDDELLELWDAPVQTTALRWGR